MKKILLNLVFAAIMITAVTSCVNVKTEEINANPNQETALERIKETKVLKIGTSGEQFPFTFKNDKGELDGIDIKIAKAMAKRMGVKAEFVEMKFDKLIPALENGDIDIIFSGLSSTLERNMNIAFSQPYFKTGKAILTKDKNLIKTFKSNNLPENTKVAVFDGSTSEHFLTENYPNVELIKVNTYEEIDNLLFEDKVNAFVGDMEICESISYSNLNVNLYLSKLKSDPEYISAAVKGDDVLFFNLTENFVRMVNDHNVGIVVDELWLEYLNN